MSKYLIPDILQFVLNEYIEHIDISKYNNALSFKFDTSKYIISKFNYHINGYIKTEREYIDDHLMKLKQYSTKGVLEGTQTEYYYNGNRKSEYRYNNGEKFDKQYIFYEDESVNFENYYINGKKVGRQYELKRNGKIKITEFYRDGVQYFPQTKKNHKIKN
jgi:antitoxin component YwqK of YwqJK toxin-antitoxin module